MTLSDSQRQALKASLTSVTNAKASLVAAEQNINAALNETDVPLPPTTPPPVSGLPTKTQNYWVHWGSSPVTDSMLRAVAQQRKYVLLNAWEGSIARTLKGYNPDIQCYVYKDASSTRSYDNNSDYALLPAGVSYQWANNNRPEWFLKDVTGARLQYSGYANHWQMDIGDTGYQAEWFKNVSANVLKEGFDGVIMDNCPLWSREAYHAGVPVVKYATDADFHDAYARFMAYVRQQSNGKFKLMANMTNARLVPGAWDRFMGYLDGAWDEWWISVSNDGRNLLSQYPEGWERQVAEVANNDAKGKFTLVQPHFPAGTSKAFWYAYASFLMGYGGRSAFVEANGTDQYKDPMPWRPQYDWDLGAPKGAYFKLNNTNNVYVRDFTNGCVIVNATNTSSSTNVQLIGSFKDESGQMISGSVSVPGLTGRVLRR